MTTTTLVSIILPLAIGIIMFGLGLSLTVKDFQEIKNSPKAVIVGLAIQMILGPLFAFILIKLTNLTPSLAIGFLLLAASPGGATSSLFSHLAKGDLALNVTLTAINSVLSAITIPVIVHFAYVYFLGTSMQIPPPLGKISQVIVLVLLPLILGMILRHRNSEFAAKNDRWVRIFSVVLLVALAIFGFIKESETLKTSGFLVISLVNLFVVGNLIIAYFSAKAAKLNEKQSIAITFEVGIHNSVMAMAIAISPALLNNIEMAIPAAFYSIFMFIASGIAVRIFLWKNGSASAIK